MEQFNINDIGGYRPGDPQDHGQGLALDVMVPVKGKKGDDVAAWAIQYNKELKVKYVIWKQRIWLPNDPNTWRTMEDRGSITQNHYDHVHISFYDETGICPSN